MASNSALARRRRQAKAEPKGAAGPLEVGEADRRLDALIEEEQSARSLDPGPRRSSSTPPLEGPRGDPVSFRPPRPMENDRDAGNHEERALRSVRPSVPQHHPQGASDDSGVDGGMAGLHDAMQRTYQALQQALTGPLQGHGQPSQVPVESQGLLGPLSLGAGPGPFGGFLGVPWTNEGLADARSAMVPRPLDYTGGTTTTPDRQQQAPMNPFWSLAGQDGVKPLANGGSSLSLVVRAQRLSGAARPPLGERGTQSPAMDEAEALRMRILREAEMRFEKELKRLSTRREPGDTNSYKTVSSGTQGPLDGELPLHGLPQRPPGLSHHARGYRDEENGGNLTSPIKIGEGVSVASTTEALRNLELPTLPAPNVEGASILSGDWLTMAFPSCRTSPTRRRVGGRNPWELHRSTTLSGSHSRPWRGSGNDLRLWWRLHSRGSSSVGLLRCLERCLTAFGGI